MKPNNKWMTYLAVVAAVLMLGAFSVWAQAGSESDKTGGVSKPSGGAGIEQGKSGAGGMKEGQTGDVGKEGKELGKAKSGGSAEGSAEIKKVQEALKDKGHDPGPIDGIVGAKTKGAIRAFQQAQGLSATGVLDDQTKDALGVGKGGASKMGGASKSKSAGGALGGAKPEGAAGGKSLGKESGKEDSQKSE
jgi:peptidoglycan hydrolase-like protein with peptidoglycan-binding domain